MVCVVLLIVSLVMYLSEALPVFGTKRYGRTPSPSHLSWNLLPMHHYAPRAAYVPYQPGPSPAAAYHDFPDYYYTTPFYASGKYVYAAPPPPLTSYYYPDPLTLPQHGYGYYSYDDEMVANDPVDNIQDEIQQEEEREEREEALPIGQETWYENSDSSNDNMADVNAIFLQNLILSQMYNDQLSRSSGESDIFRDQQRPIGQDRYGYYPVEQDGSFDEDRWMYGDGAVSDDYAPLVSQGPYDDQDVRDLKLLAKKMRRPWISSAESTGKRSGVPSLDKKEPEFVAELGPWFEGSMRFSDRKTPAMTTSAVPTTSTAPTITTTTTMTTTTAKSAFDDQRRGMKEVAVPRPANPPRHSYSSRSDHSVYDTIKKLLSMEAGLKNEVRAMIQLLVNCI